MTDTISPYVILGAGQLGLAVMDELVAQGKPATLANRSGKVGEPLPAGVNMVQADSTDPDAVARLAKDAQVVFHCAQPSYDRWPDLFPPLTRAILDGVSRTQAKLVFGDNLYMYGPTGGQPIREDLPYAATGVKGKTRAAMAKMLLDAHRAGQARLTIGRASDFYGPRVTDSTVGEIIFGAALTGKPMNLLGDIDLPHTYSYIQDFGRGLVILAESDTADGQAWHIPAAPALSTRQFAQMVADQAGTPLKTRVAGRTMVSILGLFNAQIREIKEMMYEYEEPYILDSSRFVAAFGDIATPHAQAIAATLEWYRRRHAAQ